MQDTKRNQMKPNEPNNRMAAMDGSTKMRIPTDAEGQNLVQSL